MSDVFFLGLHREPLDLPDGSLKLFGSSWSVRFGDRVKFCDPLVWVGEKSGRILRSTKQLAIRCIEKEQCQRNAGI